MNTKLTLTIDRDVIIKAKMYAKSEGRSLSDIIENYLRMITRENKEADILSTPITDSLRGSFRAAEDMDYKKELLRGLSDKYSDSNEDSD